MAKAKLTLQEMVDKYRELTAEGDPDLEGEALLTKIVKTKDPQAIELLLTLYPSEEDWNSDEMNEVISALENAPVKLFAPVFARLAARASREAPRLFSTLMSYTFGKCMKQFMAALPDLPQDDREWMAKLVTIDFKAVYRDDPIPPGSVERQEALVAALRGR